MWRQFAVDLLLALCKLGAGRHAAWHMLVNAEGDTLRSKTDAAVNWQIVSSPLINPALQKWEWLVEGRPVEGQGHVDAAFASQICRQGHRENNNDCPSRGWAVCVDKVDVRILRDVLERNICERTPIANPHCCRLGQNATLLLLDLLVHTNSTCLGNTSGKIVRRILLPPYTWTCYRCIQGDGCPRASSLSPTNADL